MNIPVDIIAYFHKDGTIKPNYIRLEDEDHTVVTHKITNTLLNETCFAGIHSMDFQCQLENERTLNLSFLLDRHIWVMR